MDTSGTIKTARESLSSEHHRRPTYAPRLIPIQEIRV
jgi:hypothetical protein